MTRFVLVYGPVDIDRDPIPIKLHYDDVPRLRLVLLPSPSTISSGYIIKSTSNKRPSSTMVFGCCGWFVASVAAVGGGVMEGISMRVAIQMLST